MKRINVNVGDRFSKLVLVSEVPAERTRRGVFNCDCGNSKELSIYDVVRGSIVSCGCYMRQRIRETHTTHGMANSPEYHAWWDMVDRCRNLTNRAYHYYGGRGIDVCDEWANSFEKFINHVGTKPTAEFELDRIDNNKGYTVGNVRWTSRNINMTNTRRSVNYIIGDKTYSTLKNASVGEGVSEGTIRNWCKGYYKNSKRGDCHVQQKY